MRVFLAALAATLVLAPTPSRGQEPATRADALLDAREEKAQALSPPSPGRLERLLLSLENGRLFERILSPPEGFYPTIGTVTPGGGFAVGPGYRRSGLVDERFDVSAFGKLSAKGYWLLDARVTMPRVADGRVFAEAYARRFDFPEEAFFGLGPASQRADESLFALHATDIGATGGVRPLPWLSLGAAYSSYAPEVRRVNHRRSLDRLFDTSTVPGFATQPHFVRTRMFADLNYREPRGNPRAGGRYLVSFEHFADRDDGKFSFNRFEADLQQYISLFRNRRVIALHGLVSMSNAEPGADVPFYLQRTLGGPDDLRGFRRYRFRDRHLLLLQAEYRWEIFSALDAALFYDAGKVASTREELDFRNLESDYGIGFRFGTANGVFLRVDGAFGSRAGKHFILRFGNVF